MTEICVECRCSLTQAQTRYSFQNFGVGLCMEHQQYIRSKFNETQPQVMGLYLALRKRGVPCQLEHYDGNKTVDIAVLEARVYIEVDGIQHHTNPSQALADVKRTYYSFTDGFITLRIPNPLVDNDLEETADWLTEIIKENRPRPNNWGKYNG